MSKNSKDSNKKDNRTFENGTHPGAYVTNCDLDKNRLEFFDLVDRMDFISPEAKKEIEISEKKNTQRSNSASSPAEDPPVPNRAHTEM